MSQTTEKIMKMIGIPAAEVTHGTKKIRLRSIDEMQKAIDIIKIAESKKNPRRMKRIITRTGL